MLRAWPLLLRLKIGGCLTSGIRNFQRQNSLQQLHLIATEAPAIVNHLQVTSAGAVVPTEQSEEHALTDRSSIDATFWCKLWAAQHSESCIPVELEAASRLVHKSAVQQAELLKGSEQALSLNRLNSVCSFTDPRLLLFWGITGNSMFCRKLQWTGSMDKTFSAKHILHTSSSMFQSFAEHFSQSSLLQLPACSTLLALTCRDIVENDTLWY